MLGIKHLKARGWRRFTIAATAIVIATTAGVTTAAATTSSDGPARPSAGPKPTIAFVHGAWADSNGWDSEITALGRLGYPVVTIPNPLRGLTSDAAYVRARLTSITGPIVLVGHSYGGAVITNAALGLPNVKALVYAAGFAPAQGESLATILPVDKYPGSHLDLTKLDAVPVPNTAAPGGMDADLYIKSAYFRDIFAADVSCQEASIEAATQRPLSAFAYGEPSGLPAYTSIPSWYLVTLDDHAISPAGQEFMAHRAGSHITEVHSSHDVMISHPGVVDEVIIKAARSVS